MKMTKRIIALLLAGIMLLGFAACSCKTKPGTQNTEATPEVTQPATEPPVTATEEPTPAQTEVPTEEPTPAPTEVPAELREAADAAFWALDEELFINYVTSDITSLDQFCEHPADFGIDETTVPVTLGDFTAEANDEWIKECYEWREKLNAIDRDMLSDQLQFAYDNYCRYFDMEIESKDWFYCYEPLDEYVGLHLNMPLFYGLYSFKDEQDIKNYMVLMEDLPRYFGQVLVHEQERAKRGLFMTEDMLNTILEDLQSVAESGETSFLHGTFREAMEEQEYLTDAQRKQYIAQNDKLVKTAYVEAYRLLHDGLEELRPMCRARKGAMKQGGDAYKYFCWKLRSEASNNRTVEDEIQFLEKLNTKIYSLMYAAAMSCYDDYLAGKKITAGSLEEDEAYLRTLMPLIVPEMPEVEVTYKTIPEELQDSFSPAAYMTPAVDGFRSNIILTNPANKTDYDMLTLAHEGFPGHMYQYVYQYSLGTIPKFQMIIETNGYAESWSTNMELQIAKVSKNSDLLQAQFLEEYYFYIILMICSLKVNGQGASLSDIRTYLRQSGYSNSAKIFYDYAIDMPIYTFKYSGGFSELYSLIDRLCEKGNEVEFFKEYLHWGPGAFDLLNERMEAWANAQ